MIVVDQVPWRMHYEQGARLAEIFHVEFSTPVDTMEVGDWDWNAGEQRRELSADDLTQELHKWVSACARAYLRELPFHR